MNKKRKFVPEISVQDAMEQAARLVESMAFEEKVEMTGGVDYFFIRPLERLGIPRVLMSDATMGINLRSEFMGVKYTNHVDKTTAFPATICLAAGWNTDLSYEYAAAVAEQCRAEGIGILLGPGLNLYRHSQCGRNFEYFGEDPYLISKMVESYVAGVQETGVVATIKHFIANNTDYFRRKSNSIVDDRTLHEIYLPGFAAGVEAGAMAVMTGYNLFNGEWCGESSYVIKTLLREELGFQWLVMTDWWSVENGERLIKSGMDIEMPYTIAAKNIQELVDTGTVQVEEIDRMVTHIVATCLAMKLYERKPEPGKYMDRYGLHEKTALRCAREGVVLLKNRDGILPLDADSGDTVLLTGKFIDTVYKGGGAAIVEGYDNVSLRQACTNAFKERLLVSEDPSDEQIASAKTVLLSVGTEDSEGWDRPFDLPHGEEEEIRRITALNPRCVVIVQSGGGINMSAWIDAAAAVLYCWYPGQNGNTAIAEILTGAVNPSGKLPITIERDFKDSPGYGYIPDGEKLYTGWNSEGETAHPVYDVTYDEGVLVGYRWYDTRKIEPLFPFGYGLSYTQFEYSSLSLTPLSGDGERLCTVSVDVTNTGDREGAEVVQLYIRDVECTVVRPEKELKGFEKITLAPGDKRTVSFTVFRRDLSYWDSTCRGFRAEDGTFEMLIGSSSRDIRLSGFYELKS